MLLIKALLMFLAASVIACAPSDPEAVSQRGAGAAVENVLPIDRKTDPHAVLPDGQLLALEIARSDAQRARGLMFRESLPPNHGMLFVFDQSEQHGFWMKNTFISLDMFWIAEDGTINDIKRGVPPCVSDPCPTYVPDRPGLYVLELAAGEAERLGLTEGDRIELRNIAGMENR